MHNITEAIKLEVETPVRPVSLLTQSHVGAATVAGGGWTGSNITVTNDVPNERFNATFTAAGVGPLSRTITINAGENGKYFGFGMDVWPGAGVNSAKIIIQWFNGGAYINGADLTSQVFDLSYKGSARRISFSGQIPGTATTGQVQVHFYSNTAGTVSVASGQTLQYNFITWNVDTELAWADNTDYRQGGLSNLVNNPSGLRGNEGWTSSTADVQIAGTQYGPAFYLRGANDNYYAMTTTKMPVTAGKWVNSSVRVIEGDNGVYTLKLQFYDASNNPVAGGTTYTYNNLNTPPQSLRRRLYGTKVQVPAGATQVTLEVGVDATGVSGYPGSFGQSEMWFNEATVAQHSDSNMVTGIYYLNNEAEWTDVIGPTHQINLKRVPLEVGSLTATVLDSQLDPGRTSIVRPGKLVRLSARVEDHSWKTLFYGEMNQAEVHYVNGKTRVTLQGLDAGKTLASTRSPGFAINPTGLRSLNWGGVGFNINGSSAPSGTTAGPDFNKDATTRDQIAMVRDTDLGFAWVTPDNILMYRSPAQMVTASQATFDESVYSDIDVVLNTSEVINEVYIKSVVYDSVNNQSIETVYGPYTNAGSIAEWGRFPAQYTMQGVDATAAATKAATILAANAQPKVRVSKVAVPVKIIMSTLNGNVIHRYPASIVQRDLYDPIRVKYADAQYDEVLRIREIEYNISPSGWFATFDFKNFDTVEKPDTHAGEATVSNPTSSSGSGTDPNAIHKDIVDANGDLIVGTGADTVGRFPVGLSGQVLTAEPSLPGGMAWGDPAVGLNTNTFNAKGDLLVGTMDNAFNVLPRGVTDGMVLRVHAASTEGVRWENPPWILPNGYDAKGDLFVGTGNDTFGVLPKGADNSVLTADSTTATGLKWAASGSGVTDHGALTGLADDDHPQYYNQTRGDARYQQKFANGHVRSTVATSNIVNSTTTLASALFLASTLTAGASYYFRVAGQYQTAATTTGILITPVGTNGLTFTSMRANLRIWGAATNANTPQNQNITASGGGTVTTGVVAASTPYHFELEGTFVVNTAGAFDIQFRSEVASSAATLLAPLSLSVTQVSA